MSWLSGIGDWFGGLFGGGAGGGAAWPSDPGGLTEFAAPAAGGGGGSWWGDLFGGLGTAAKVATPLIGLGTAGLGAYGAIQGMQEAKDDRRAVRQAQETQQQIMAPQLAQGQALTAAGTQALLGGALPEGLEAQASEHEKKLRAQIAQYLSRAGIADSTMKSQWDAWIGQQGKLYRSQLAQGLMQPGQQALSVAGQSAAGLAGAGRRADSTDELIQSANAAMAALQAATGER